MMKLTKQKPETKDKATKKSVLKFKNLKEQFKKAFSMHNKVNKATRSPLFNSMLTLFQQDPKQAGSISNVAEITGQHGVVLDNAETPLSNEPSTLNGDEAVSELVLPLIDAAPQISIGDLTVGEDSGPNVSLDGVAEASAEILCRPDSPTIILDEIQGGTRFADYKIPLRCNVGNDGKSIDPHVAQSHAAIPLNEPFSEGHASKYSATNDSGAGSLLQKKRSSSIGNTVSSTSDDMESGGVSLHEVNSALGFDFQTPRSTASSPSDEESSSGHTVSKPRSPSMSQVSPLNIEAKLDLPSAGSENWKRNKRSTALKASTVQHDRSGSGSTLVNTPTRRDLTPTPFELNFLARCRAAQRSSLGSSPANSSSTKSQSLQSERVERHDFGAGLTNTLKVNDSPPDKKKILDAIRGLQTSSSTPILDHIDKIKAAYKELEDNEWIVLKAWTELWHQAEINELKKQLSISEATVRSREVDIDNNKDDFDAKLEEVKEHRNKAVRASNEKRAKFNSAIQENNTLKAEALSAKKKMDGLEKEVDSLNGTLDFEQQTYRAGKEFLETQLDEKSAIIDNMLPQLQQLQIHVDLNSSRDITTAEVFWLQSENDALKNKNWDQERENNQLRQNLEFSRAQTQEAEAETEKLRAQEKAADLEAGFMHAMNMQFRATMEDENPAPTAQLDARLKRMDEEGKRLEAQVVEYSAALDEEKLARDVDREYFAEQFEDEQNKVKFWKDRSVMLESSRDAYSQHNQEVLEKLKGKLWRDDVIEQVTKEKEILREDNVQLLAVLQERENSIQDATELDADRRFQILRLTSAATVAEEKVKQAEIDINGLEIHNHRLEAGERLQEPFVKILEDNKNLQTLTQRQADRIEEMVKNGPDNYISEHFKAKDRDIEMLQAKNDELLRYNNTWAQREMEREDGFCYVHQMDRVVDWNGKDVQTRLKRAEKGYREMQMKLEKHMGPGHEPWAHHQPCTAGDGPYYGQAL